MEIRRKWHLGLALLGTLVGQSAAGAEVDSVRLEPGPVGRLTMSVLFGQDDDEVRLKVRALRVDPLGNSDPAPIKAHGAEHRDADGNFLIEQVFRKADGDQQDVTIAIDPGEFELAAGLSNVGLTIEGMIGDSPAFLAATPLAQVEFEAGASRILTVETVPNILPILDPGSPSEMLPPPPGAVLPAPQAPGKSLPDPFAPSKALPAPMLPSAMATTRDGMGRIQAEMAARVQPNVAERRLIYFATNRNRIEGTQGQDLNSRFGNNLSPGNALTYGSCLVNVPIWIDGKPRPAGDLPVPSLGNFYRKTDKVFYTEPPAILDWNAVEAAFKRVGPAGEDDILVLVHGFNNTMEAASLRLAQVSQDTGFLGRSVLFSWPSDGTFLLSINDLRNFPQTSYSRDGQMAAQSDEPLAKLLGNLSRIQASKPVQPGKPKPRVHVIAHSMGNRVLLNAMKRLESDPSLAGRKPLGHVVLAAPDVASSQFRSLAPTATKVADDVTLYYNRDDWALLSSHYIANRVARAGEDGAFDELTPGQDPVLVRKASAASLDRIDAHKANTSILGHDYAMAGDRLLRDLRLLLHDNKRAAARDPLKGGIYNPGEFSYFLFP